MPRKPTFDGIANKVVALEESIGKLEARLEEKRAALTEARSQLDALSEDRDALDAWANAKAAAIAKVVPSNETGQNLETSPGMHPELRWIKAAAIAKVEPGAE